MGVMALGLLSGCGSKKDTDDGDNTLTVGIPLYGSITDFENVPFTKYIEENLGIKLKFVNYVKNASDRQQQLTLQATGGEKLPDVLWGFQETSRITVYEFGDAGYFQDLTELIDKYADNYKAQFAKLDKEEQDYINDRGTSGSGGFYGMPLYCAFDVVDDLQNMMYINQSWLDKLGLKAPTTIEELRAVLEAFKNGDPNGNGKADEIPMLGRNISAYVINAFQYFDTTYPVNVENGKTTPSFTSNEYRQALIYLNELCKQGLYSDMSITLSNNNEFMSLITPTDGVSKVGIWCGHPLSYTDISSSILREYTALGALSDATGKGGYTVVHPRTLMFCGFITRDCKNPELAMKFLDFFYKDDTVTWMRHGAEGVNWQRGTGTNVLGTEAFFEKIETESTDPVGWGINGNAIFTTANYMPVYNENSNNDRLLAATWEVQNAGKRITESTAHLVYTQEEEDQRTSLEGTIKSEMSSARDLFITGKKDPKSDADWNAYLKTIEDLKLSELVALYQTVYDRAK